jgi:hypothetical protein
MSSPLNTLQCRFTHTHTRSFRMHIRDRYGHTNECGGYGNLRQGKFLTRTQSQSRSTGMHTHTDQTQKP